MNDRLTSPEKVLRFARRHRGLIIPVMAAGMLFVVLVPLPSGLMDIMLAANIALAAVILLTTIYVSSPLEFSVFPSLLLGVTLFRLVLNVATTRLILTSGAEGRTIDQAQLAAGRVIWSFSNFVTSGSLAVGIVIFAIIAVIQFVVITKGAARISEVAARFVLDAMPGRQMGIDAELSSGAITETEARTRRKEIGARADFYGAMDGASKFLRGDAVAAVVITLVNILGGMYVGLVQYRWNWSQTVDLFTRLTIGDGLVAQVPAVIVSVSAALLVTRNTERTNLGDEVVKQLVSRPAVLVITAIFLGALSLTSLPKLPLLILGAGLVGLAVMLTRRKNLQQRDDRTDEEPPSAQHLQDVDDLGELMTVDPIRVELGYSLAGMVQGVRGDLLERIGRLRRGIAGELGILVPPIKIRDEMRLGAHSYVILIRSAKVASGKLYPRELLAVAGSSTTGALTGRETTEPVFGTPGLWISPSQRSHAEMMNYTVVDPPDVLVTHLGQIIRSNAPELLSREQVATLLDKLHPRAPHLVDEVTERFRVGDVQKVLQDLLREGVSIRDMETILEAMTDCAPSDDDPESVMETVRGAMKRILVNPHCDNDGKLWCIRLDPQLEETIASHTRSSSGGKVLAMSPELTDKVTCSVRDGLNTLHRAGHDPVVLCTPRLRLIIKRFVDRAVPGATVLGYNEVDYVQVQPLTTVRIES